MRTNDSKKGDAMIYIGNMLYLSNQQNDSEEHRRHGEFNLVVDADSRDMAVDMFRKRIIDLKETHDFFEGQTTIFLNQLLEFDRISKMEATVVNFKSVIGDPIMPFIGCTLPSDVTDDCKIFDWDDDRPQIDRQQRKPFLEFH